MDIFRFNFIGVENTIEDLGIAFDTKLFPYIESSCCKALKILGFVLNSNWYCPGLWLNYYTVPLYAQCLNNRIYIVESPWN